MTSGPDPIGFVVDSLTDRGALAERDGSGAVALLPPGIASALGVSEDLRLELEARDGAVACGMGSPLLERLVTEARASVPVTWASVDRDPPRATHAVAVAERLVIRNGLAEVAQVSTAEGHYVAVTFAFVAESDDRHEGTVTVAVEAQDGGWPHSDLLRLVDAGSSALKPERTDLFDASLAAPWLASRAHAAVASHVDPIAETLARRFARDRARIVEYFDALLQETAAAGRRRQDPDAIEAKASHLRSERDAKLRDLPTRFALRVRLRPAAVIAFVAPVARVVLRARRRKGEREIVIRLPPESESFDALACAACGGGTVRPALCDDALHPLCERCVPSAQGRPVCRACNRRGR